MKDKGHSLPGEFQLHYVIERVKDSDETALHIRSYLTEDQARSQVLPIENNWNKNMGTSWTRDYEYGSADDVISMVNAYLKSYTQHDTVYYVG